MNAQRLSCLIAAFTLACAPIAAQGALIGHWTFPGANPLADSAGNFPDLVLKGGAAIVGGELDLFDGIAGQDWAITGTAAGGYGGPGITNKTLVSWLTLDGLASTASQGSALTLDRESGDHFDGIVYSERQGDRWMNGSNGHTRSVPDFSPGFQETTTGSKILMATTYEYTGTNFIVRGYRDGSLIGTTTLALAAGSSWATGDAEVIFGARHHAAAGKNTPNGGSINARIDEAWIFNEVLTAAQINALVPEPSSGLLIAIAGFVGLRFRRRVK